MRYTLYKEMLYIQSYLMQIINNKLSVLFIPPKELALSSTLPRDDKY